MEPKIDADTLARVRTIFTAFTPIPDDEWEYAASLFVPAFFPKQTFLIEAEEIVDRSFIILDGLVRVFYITEDGKEFNRDFFAENGIVGSVTSMIHHRPSRFYAEALEDTRAVGMLRSAVHELYDRHPCWDRLGRVIAELGLIQFETRDAHLTESLEDRYRRFLKDYPGLDERMPQYHVASYLGITNVSLSRLRKRMDLI